MPDARDIAFKTLQQWSLPATPPAIPERSDADEHARHWAQLPPRDRAFAFDLVTGVIRWRNLLDAVIASRLRQALDTLDIPVRAILWLGAYQLLMQSGTTEYAAVDTSVTLARRNRSTTKAAGLVNAVLRGITRLRPRRVPMDDKIPPELRLTRRGFALDFSTMVMLSEDLLPDPVASLTPHLAVVRSHPAAFVDYLRKILGDAVAGQVLLRNNLRPLITLRVDAETLDAPAAAGLVPHAEIERMLVAGEGWNDLVESLVTKGKLSPQDPTAAKPVRRYESLVTSGRLRTPIRILDMCAGLGTKTLQLARAFPDSTVIGADVDDGKLQRLSARASGVGQKNIAVQAIEPLLAQDARTPPFDLVLVDVPCSNSGVMGKRIQSRWRWPLLDREALHALQRKLLTQAQQLVAPGGTIIYATCSIDPGENGDVALAWLKLHHATLAEEASTLPSTSANPTSTHDGGYYAIMQVPS